MGIGCQPTAKCSLSGPLQPTSVWDNVKVVVALLGHLVKEEALGAPQTKEMVGWEGAVVSAAFQDSLCGIIHPATGRGC